MVVTWRNKEAWLLACGQEKGPGSSNGKRWAYSSPRASGTSICPGRLLFSSFSLISLIADGPHHCHLPVATKDFPISPRFTPYDFLSRCKFSTLTTRQPMVEFYLLTFPRFPFRKKEHKSYFGKNRTHDFRTSRCAGYLLFRPLALRFPKMRRLLSK